MFNVHFVVSYLSLPYDTLHYLTLPTSDIGEGFEFLSRLRKGTNECVLLL
jgi:hypothetical protein